MEQTDIYTLIAAGGVSANRQLRQRLAMLADEMGGKVFYPRPEYCTDNGAMIAYAGYLYLNRGLLPGDRSKQHSFAVYPRWPIPARADIP